MIINFKTKIIFPNFNGRDSMKKARLTLFPRWSLKRKKDVRELLTAASYKPVVNEANTASKLL